MTTHKRCLAKWFVCQTRVLKVVSWNPGSYLVAVYEYVIQLWKGEVMLSVLLQVVVAAHPLQTG